MNHPLEIKLSRAWPPSDWADVTVMAAVSGGCDSVALLRAIVAMKTGGSGRIAVAHLNHALRLDADVDERFVVELCKQLGVACEVGHVAVDRLAAESGDGLEAAARTLRYQFLEQTAARLGARYVAVAHTADDQAETILHRIIRGTGIRGMAGMARARPLGHATLIRPLLGIRRAELRSYLDALGQPFRHDPSNADRRFTRNRIRHDVLPLLCEQFNPAATDALLRLGGLAGEAQEVIDRLVDELFERCVSIHNPLSASIDPQALAGRPRYLIRELLTSLWRRQGWPMQAMGRRKWDELGVLLATSAPRKRSFPGGITVEVVPGRILLCKQRG